MGLTTVDAAHTGTPEAAWAASGRIEGLPPLALRPWRRAVIVAPHPDDEVLGAGGLLAALVALGVPVHVVAVTEGEGSHPASRAAASSDLATRRHLERAEALARLTPGRVRVSRLGLPDGAVADHVGPLARALAPHLGPDDLCVAPWAADGHPDHDAAGLAVRDVAAAVGADLLGYVVWAWHWARPDRDDLPWGRCRQLDLGRRGAAAKRWATSAYTSQIRAIGPEPADGAVLPDAVLRRSWRRREVFVVGGGHEAP